MVTSYLSGMGASRGSVFSSGSKSNRRTQLATMVVTVSSENSPPMQLLGPAPKGV